MFDQETFAVCTVAIIVVTSIYSWLGFRNPGFCEEHLFSVREILAGKQYPRLFTSALLHADWGHLVLNMLSLYLFGSHIEALVGVWKYLGIYWSAVLGGNLLSLWIHRQHEYRAYGASGGVCGIIFSYIFLAPGGGVVVFPLPISIPAWLYAILFFIGSVVAFKRQKDNIGHDAHLGGAIIGLWITAILEPQILEQQPKLFVALSGLAVLFFVYLVKNPLLLPLGHWWPIGRGREATKKVRPAVPAGTEKLDAVLEKISRSGINSLTRRERALLENASKEFRRRPNQRTSDS